MRLLGAYIHIAGGVLHIDASGDGVDSNGDITVSGGETYLSGPTNGGNGTLDYSGSAAVTGGILRPQVLLVWHKTLIHLQRKAPL